MRSCASTDFRPGKLTSFTMACRSRRCSGTRKLGRDVVKPLASAKKMSPCFSPVPGGNEKTGKERRLLVAGRGEQRKFRSKRVQFLGVVEDMPGLYAAADIFLAPTLYDPFSNACLEALAA